MADETAVLGVPFPESGDTADVPRDIEALAQWLEDNILDGPIWVPGDIKFTALAADHGRWLLCDGRELNQAAIESALSLDSGQGAGLISALGTGSSSKYGNAATGKVKLPDMADKFPVVKGADHPLKGSGSTGGTAVVTLTAAQSGLPAHDHDVTDPGHVHTITDPGHTHGASQASHNHAITVVSATTGITATTDSKTPTITVNESAHSHGWGTLATDSQTPTIKVTDPGHHHGLPNSDDSSWMPSNVNSGSGGASVALTGSSLYKTYSTGTKVTGVTAAQDSHSHTAGSGATATATTGITATNASHNHTVTVTDGGHTHTASSDSKTPAVTVSSITTGITGANSHSTGVTVDSVSAAAASDSHENLPPYQAIGSVFMRV